MKEGRLRTIRICFLMIGLAIMLLGAGGLLHIPNQASPKTDFSTMFFGLGIAFIGLAFFEKRVKA